MATAFYSHGLGNLVLRIVSCIYELCLYVYLVSVSCIQFQSGLQIKPETENNDYTFCQGVNGYALVG